MQYVKRYTDRTGALRLYFRKKGHPCDGAALRSAWPECETGSLLRAEVDALLDLQRTKPKPVNLAGALRRYELEDPRWKVLEASTRAEYQRYLKEFADDLGALPIEAFTPAFLLDLQNAWAARGHRAAELRMNVLQNALGPVLIARGLSDPFSRLPGVPRPRRDEEPHRIWPEWVVEVIIKAAISQRRFGLARAIAIGRYTGARRGDIVKMAKSARRDGRISWRSGKKRVPVDQPEAAELSDWLGATPAAQPLSHWQEGSDRRRGVTRLMAATLVFNRSGVAYTEDGLGQELAKLVAALHLKGAIDSADYDLHGLRHTMGVELALAGSTDAQGAAWLGHASPHSFATYRRQASRLLLTNSAGDLVRELRKRAAGTSPESHVSNKCLEVSNAGATVTTFRGR